MLQRWWSLSKLVTDIFANFGNFFNSQADGNGEFPSAWGIMIKTWGRFLLGGMSETGEIQFFDSQIYLQ